jgi:RNA polymerase sigma factor (sigma-70 family)
MPHSAASIPTTVSNRGSACIVEYGRRSSTPSAIHGKLPKRPPRVLSEAEQDSLIVRISALAWKFAAELHEDDIYEDIAQDVVCQALVRLRSGRWNTPLEFLEPTVRVVVKRMKRRWYEKTVREEERRLFHTEELVDSLRGWMDPDLAFDEAQLREVYVETLQLLPARWARAHVLVRELDKSYKHVATDLGVSVAAVHKYVTKTQQALRAAIRRLGIDRKHSDHGGRPAGAAQLKKKAA